MTPTAHRAPLDLPWGDSLAIVLPDDYDFLASHVAQAGSYFPPSFELALDLARPGATIIDLGAHLGTFTLAAAACGNRVIAVEASPRNAALLEESARANRLDKSITVVQVAVSNRSGTVRFQHEGPWGQISGSKWADNVVDVPARTVPEILAELGVGRVDVVKMDVEGSEIAAIEGMHPLLSAPDAPMIVYESNAHTLRMFDATPEHLVEAFAECGYDNYLVGDPELELTPVASESFQPETIVDYVAVKGLPELSPKWRVRDPRTDSDLASVIGAESRTFAIALRAQLARSLERAPARLLSRRDVQLTLDALVLDPDETVARAAAWWTHSRRDPRRTANDLAGVRQDFELLGEQGRALRDRIDQIRVRWGVRP
jgi:FkbM family methyltransferase